jgi:hypothetical protein
MQRIAGDRLFLKMASLRFLLELFHQGLEAFFKEFDLRLVNAALFRASQLQLDQFLQEIQPELLIEMDEVGFDFTGPHQVDAGKQNPEDIQQGLHPWGFLLLEEAPLVLGEALAKSNG